MIADKTVHSEFPSLSGGPQVQNQNAMPQAWNSNTLRQAAPPQHASSQRPSQPVIQQREVSGSQQSIQSQSQSQSQQLDAGFGSIGSVEGQFDGQRQPANSSQSGAADDFPPLGGATNGERQERQNSILQGPTFSAGVNGNGFGEGRVAGLGQAVNGQDEGEDALSQGSLVPATMALLTLNSSQIAARPPGHSGFSGWSTTSFPRWWHATDSQSTVIYLSAKPTRHHFAGSESFTTTTTTTSRDGR